MISFELLSTLIVGHNVKHNIALGIYHDKLVLWTLKHLLLWLYVTASVCITGCITYDHNTVSYDHNTISHDHNIVLHNHITVSHDH